MSEAEKETNVRPHKLSTEFLTEKFGPLDVAILEQSRYGRIVCLRAKQDGRPLAYSTVHFTEAMSQETPELFTKIQGGALLGQSFKESGIAFSRTETAERAIELPPGLRILFNTSTGRARKVEFRVAGRLLADVLEIYPEGILEDKPGHGNIDEILQGVQDLGEYPIGSSE